MNDSKLSFSAQLQIIGINPFVFLPDEILSEILLRAQKEKGNIPVKVAVNGGKCNLQTLLRFQGEWRLYINTKMLKNSPKRIGEKLEITIDLDKDERIIQIHPLLTKALAENAKANGVFNSLRPSLQKEIIKYISFLKTEENIKMNVDKAIKFLLGEGRFIGRKL